MTERLLAALTDNGKWLEGFTRLGYESTFREYCNRFTPDYLAAVREAGESGLPALADSLLDALEAQWKQARFWNRTTVRGETKQVVVGYLTPMLMADPGTAALCGRSAGPLELALAQGCLSCRRV